MGSVREVVDQAASAAVDGGHIADAHVAKMWGEALWRFYLLARSERARELRGERRVRSFEKTVHPPSVEWGRLVMCEQLLPGLAELRDADDGPLWPWTIRLEAYQEAERTFLEEAAAGEVEFASRRTTDA